MKVKLTFDLLDINQLFIFDVPVKSYAVDELEPESCLGFFLTWPWTPKYLSHHPCVQVDICARWKKIPARKSWHILYSQDKWTYWRLDAVRHSIIRPWIACRTCALLAAKHRHVVTHSHLNLFSQCVWARPCQAETQKMDGTAQQNTWVGERHPLEAGVGKKIFKIHISQDFFFYMLQHWAARCRLRSVFITTCVQYGICL